MGSRFAAASIDLLIQLALLGALALLLLGARALAGVGSGGARTAVYSILAFLVLAGYDVFFEVLASGRTPGKRWNSLRVVRSDGRPVGLLSSAVRNLLRVIDFLPTAYLVGAVSVFATSRNQRLGDLAADTVVVRERRGRVPVAPPRAPATLTPALARWDASAVTPEELAAVRRFLARRAGLDVGAREELARTLVERLRPKVAGAPDEYRGERFLEALSAVKAARG